MDARQVRMLIADVLKGVHLESRETELKAAEMQLGRRPVDNRSPAWHQGYAAGLDSMVRRMIHLLELSAPKGSDDDVLPELREALEAMPSLDLGPLEAVIPTLGNRRRKKVRRGRRA